MSDVPKVEEVIRTKAEAAAPACRRQIRRRDRPVVAAIGYRSLLVQETDKTAIARRRLEGCTRICYREDG